MKGVVDEGEVDEGEEDAVQLVVAGGDATEALERRQEKLEAGLLLLAGEMGAPLAKVAAPPRS